MGFLNFYSIQTETKLDMAENAYYYASSTTETDESTSLNFGLAVRNGNLFARPSITRTDGESSFNITFGFLLPQ